ncbi:MAG: AAA family ATPase [Thermodesulfobacteriota bacterium]|nr:AAA family ATPase [Thermodesulfobacteriota bacterium]
MAVKAALKQDLEGVKEVDVQPIQNEGGHDDEHKKGGKEMAKDEGGQVYDDELHDRFTMWKDMSGRSVQAIAVMLARSTAAVSQYINKKYVGDLLSFEESIRVLLEREENMEFVSGPKVFCNTKPAILIWEVLQYCDSKCKMGVALAPSGTGKTEACKEYKRSNPATVFVTADISTRSLGSVMRLIAGHTGASKRPSISENLQNCIDKLKGSRRLLIIDDAHFLSWESFEFVRKIHDCAGIGVVYIGQERMYEQMKGVSGKAYLFDQIYSRIAIKRDRFGIKKSDVKKIAESIIPGINNDCIDFLFQKARGKGRYRFMTNIIDMAMEMHKNFSKPINISLLREAERFLLSG